MFVATSRALVAITALSFLAPGLQAGDEGSDSRSGYRLIRVPLRKSIDRREIGELGVDVAAMEKDAMVLVVPRDRRAGRPLERLLQDAENVEVLSEDVDGMFGALAADADLGDYHTYDEAVAELKGHAEAHPDRCAFESIGTTVEGREIPALHVGTAGNDAWGKPAFVFMGAHHAREWISIEVPLSIARTLVTSYDDDARIRNLVDTREVWVVPMVNPDGVVYSQTRQRYWRKNRRDNGDGSFGVDPNRNYSYKWGTSGASPYPSSDTYRGPEAFSEPCTQAIRDLARRIGLTGSISFHSYGQLVLHPWSYGYEESPDAGVFSQLAQELAAINGYEPMQSSGLYPSSGDTDDHLYGDQGSLSYTIELGRTFIPDPEDIPEIAAPNVAVALHLLEKGADAFPLGVHEALADTPSLEPIPVSIRTDAAHNKTFTAETATLVVTLDGETREIAMEADPGNAGVFTGAIPARTAPGSVRYFFGLTAADGRKGRTPRATEFEFRSGEAALAAR